MAALSNPLIIAAFAAAGALILALALILFIRRSNKKKDNRIMEAFGKVPVFEDKDIKGIDSYHNYFAKANEYNKRIDETTWNDLNMDDVFLRMNACSSSVGEEYLYHLLHDIEQDEDILENRGSLVEWFAENPQKRLETQKILASIGKRRNNGLSFYIFNADAKKIKHAWILTIMAALPLAGLLLMSFFIVAGVVMTAASILANFAVYYFTSLKIESQLESMKYFSSMLFGAKALRKEAGEELKQKGFDLESAIKPFKKLGGMMPGRAKQNLIELEALTVIFKAVFLLDLVLYNRAVNTMHKHKKEFGDLYRLVGEIDTAISTASFRKSIKHCCTPQFTEEKGVKFNGMLHPLLKDPVTNSGALVDDSLITGSNASGKSTFIKGIAVNNILAQTIYTCCARQYKLKRCYVATSMAIRDNIVSAESYFVAEIKSLKRIVGYTKEQYCTCFIDEILRGTNTNERIAASTAVLHMLHGSGSICVVASHDIELTKILKDSYDNYHFSEKIKGNEIEFDYLLKEGPSRTTNAIKLLEYMGFEKQVVDEALRLLES